MNLDRRDMILGGSLLVSSCRNLPEQANASASLDSPPARSLDLAQGSRRWLGPRWWANRLQDWRQQGAWLECVPRNPFEPWRNAVELCTALCEAGPEMAISWCVDLSGPGSDIRQGRFAGLTLGHGQGLAWRQRPMVFEHRAGQGSGHFFGLTGEGRLAYIDLSVSSDAVMSEKKAGRLDTGAGPIELRLLLNRDNPAGGLQLVLQGRELTSVKEPITLTLPCPEPQLWLAGGYALTCHHGAAVKGRAQADHSIVSRFTVPVIEGIKLHSQPEEAFGPFALSQYTVSRGQLKLSAQLLPLAPEETKEIRLEFHINGRWQEVARAPVARPELVALFRVALAPWGGGREAIDFRLVTELPGIGDAYRHGRIAAEPTTELSMAVLGCIIHRPWGAAGNWQRDLFFPHEDAAARVEERQPDLVFFYGDQMYEGTPTYPDWKESEEDYLYKWYFHAYAFGELIRKRPSISITDDHDAFQGNIWGNGGGSAPGRNPNKGGFIGSESFINVVHATTCAHLPDSVLPVQERGIRPYTCELTWGGVSFAILMDRFFKSGPLTLTLPSADAGRPDHYRDATRLDVKQLDVAGLNLLGDAQERFLLEWAGDWRGAQIKAVLSQSPFGMYSTHHSSALEYYWLDLDANGWPQTPRKRAVDLLRRARALHIAGDQHLPTLVRYGVDQAGDAGYSFTAPATANAYPRAWAPKQAGKSYRHQEGDFSMLGPQLDPFGNPMDMIACANPRDWGGHRQGRDHWSPGLGMVVFQTQQQTSRIECWPLSSQACRGHQYTGWPFTTRVQDQDGRKPLCLKELDAGAIERPVVRVCDAEGELLWAQRFPHAKPLIPFYAPGLHFVEYGDGEGAWSKLRFDIAAQP